MVKDDIKDVLDIEPSRVTSFEGKLVNPATSADAVQINDDETLVDVINKTVFSLRADGELLNPVDGVIDLPVLDGHGHSNLSVLNELTEDDHVLKHRGTTVARIMDGPAQDKATWSSNKVLDEINEAIYVSDQAPADINRVWFDTSDESQEHIPLPEDSNLANIQDSISDMRDKISALHASSDDICPGTFYKEGSSSDKVDEDSDKVTFVKIKTGSQKLLRLLAEGELAYCQDTGRMYIGVRKHENTTLTENRLIFGGGDIEGGDEDMPDNLTGEYLDLEARNGKSYRFFIDADGRFKQRDIELLTAAKPNIDDAGVGERFKGLIINKYYGGGATDNGVSPLSHSFIELYNNCATERAFSLNGLCIYYKTIEDGIWRRLELDGYIPHKCSYLIRCNRLNVKTNSSCRYEILNYDKSWDEEMSSDSAMIYLSVDNGMLSAVNPFKLADGNKLKGYIDLMASANPENDGSLSALEYGSSPHYARLIGPENGFQRKDFTDKDNAYTDFETIDYRKCDIRIHKPRCVDDGQWDLYMSKAQINPNTPNLLNMLYGSEWSTRVITWQSAVTERGFFKYRKQGDTSWTFAESNTEVVYHNDCDVTVHRVLIKGLEEGVYEYQAGSEGMWGDVSMFTVKSYKKADGTPDENSTIKILHITDQQAALEPEYQAWRWASKYMEDNLDFDKIDFVLNTGDISQSANRAFEWRNYFKYPQFLKSHCHMLTCGNNDLFNKVYSNCFKYYETNENDFTENGDLLLNAKTHDIVNGSTPFGRYYSSAYSYRLGECYFASVNSNASASTEDPELWLKQMKWLRQDVIKARTSANPPRWYILIAHHGAFTVTRMKGAQFMVPYVEDLGFNAVFCGHHHTYTRSTPIRMNIKDKVEQAIRDAGMGTGLYDCQPGASAVICNTVYATGYLESFEVAGVKKLPAGVTWDQTTTDGMMEDGMTLGEVANGNNGSREAYVSEEEGTVWCMAQASGAKLKSNKDLEKTPTPWFYGWVSEIGDIVANNPHPYDPQYTTYEISHDSITLNAYIIKGIMQYDDVLSTAVQIPANEFSYNECHAELIDSVTIPWRDVPYTAGGLND